MIRRHGRDAVWVRAEYRTMGRASGWRDGLRITRARRPRRLYKSSLRTTLRARNNRALRFRHGVDFRRGRRFLGAGQLSRAGGERDRLTGPGLPRRRWQSVSHCEKGGWRDERDFPGLAWPPPPASEPDEAFGLVRALIQ